MSKSYYNRDQMFHIMRCHFSIGKYGYRFHPWDDLNKRIYWRLFTRVDLDGYIVSGKELINSIRLDQKLGVKDIEEMKNQAREAIEELEKRL